MNEHLEIATLAAGCFWCYQPIFSSLAGVEKVTPGYSGGSKETANYQATSYGGSDNAEAFQIEFNPEQISYQEILEVFWNVHNPTTLNRQGHDVGRQYRSAIFYHSEEQKQIAEKSKQDFEASGAYSDPVVTEITKFNGFVPAEDYHQDYYNKNPNSSYSRLVTKPKIQKFEELFADKLKEKYI